MKTIRLFLFLSAFVALGIYSCTDSDAIQNTTTPAQQSTALRTALNEIKKATPTGNRTAGRTADSPLCFNFVYPITLSYNTATTNAVTVTSFEGLLELLGAETTNLYLAGITYPFQVMQEGTVTTISDEAAFTALLVACGYNTINDDLNYSYCFDLVFPIQVVLNNQNVTITSMAGFQAFLQNPANGIVGIVFPISATYQGQVVVIDNLYALYELINSCDDCICTLEYAPVCVQTATGVQEFGNMCFAMCAGYTQNDLVPCGNSPYCDISNLTVTTGACNADGSYALTIDFNATNAAGSQFEVYTNQNVLVGTYDLSALPLTIPNYPNNNQPSDLLVVRIPGITGCTATQQWGVPNCCPCPANVDPVCVMTNTGLVSFNNACEAECAGFTTADFVPCNNTGTYNFGALLGSCFFIQYPAQIQYNGQVVTVNSDGQCLQYWFPAGGPMPAFVYPITVTVGNIVTTVTSQAGFEALISQHCN